MLTADGKKAERLAHYEIALQIMKTVRPDLQVEDSTEVKEKIAQLKAAGVVASSL